MINSASSKSFPFNVDIYNNIPRTQPSISGLDVPRIIELINATDDIDLLVKLFTVLAVHLVTNDTYKCEIITNNNIYDKIRHVLSNGHFLKTVKTLNFVTALLYLNEDEDEGASRAHTLVLYAQNMIRISGCLLQMCTMFTGCMLHQETWRALCQCIAESCRKSTENQSYCSHLVPLAVQKCIQGNVEAREILRNLVYNHKYNTQLFVESNGITIFNRRESLLNDTSMQLLNYLVQNSSLELLSLIHETVFQNLNHLKHLYGTENRIGQWATIIWHRLNTRSKVISATDCGYDNNIKLNAGQGKEEILKNNSSVIDIGFLKPDDTARLLQNVIREIHQFNAKNNVIKKMGRLTNEIKNETQDYYNKNQMCQNKELDKNKYSEKSKNVVDPNRNITSSLILSKKQSLCSDIGFSKYNSVKSTTVGVHNRAKKNMHTLMETNTSDNIMTITHNSQQNATYHNEDPSLLVFNPTCVSTPKKIRKNNKARDSRKSLHPSRQKSIHEIDKLRNKTLKNNCISRNKVPPQRVLKNRSISSRFFHAINDSCTTFVKTVKNIFKPKKDDIKDQSPISLAYTGNNVEASCSYSFTDYMRKRDAILFDETLEKERHFSAIHESKNIKSCKTCNDTVSLKCKMDNNNYLKETVTKLKLGINLYGCDFKKISKAMWPRETYMTPEVLYNLYRKLLLK